MKNLISFISVIFISFTAQAQFWQLYNPQLNAISCDLLIQQTPDTILVSEVANNDQDIMYSTDGGKNFMQMYTLPLGAWGNVHHVRFIAADTLLYITSKGILKRSFNSADLPFFIIYFDDYDTLKSQQTPVSLFFNGDSGIVACSHVFKTFDGGKNWQLFGETEYYSNGGVELFYLPKSKRYIMNRGFKMAESWDNGKTWQQLMRIREIANSGEWPDINAMSVVNDSTFFITLNDGGFTHAKSLLFKSTDAGKTWQSIIQYPYRLWTHFFDTLNGYALAENSPNIVKTEDGGKTWTIEYSFKGDNFNGDKLYYINDSTFLATNQGKLYKRSKKLSLTVQPQTVPIDVSVYPNPISEVLNIEMQENQLPVSALITDTQGKTIVKKMLHQTANTIDLSELKNGIYILTINIDSQVATYKIIKE